MRAERVHPAAVQHRLVRVVGEHDEFHVHVALAQQLHEAGRLLERHVPVVVAVNEQHRRSPRVDRPDGRRLERQRLGIERTAAEVNAREVHAQP